MTERVTTGQRTTVRIAAIGDLHCRKDSRARLAPILAAAGDAADVLLLAGDLTDYGLPEEAELLAEELARIRIPVLAVLGNHDFESDQPGEIRRILEGAGVRVLDGEAVEVAGIGVAGIKGFAGGFGRGALGPWGEASIKAFVQEAVDEALKLESALARLRTPSRIALLHYAPVRGTVEGEPPEILPYLGTSRLEEPLLRYPVDAVFHGHAHGGSPEGRTQNGIPVFNVALPLRLRLFPGETPFLLHEIPLEPEEGVTPGRPRRRKDDPLVVPPVSA